MYCCLLICDLRCVFVDVFGFGGLIVLFLCLFAMRMSVLFAGFVIVLYVVLVVSVCCSGCVAL